MIKFDTTYKEVDPPDNMWCDCGHVAPKTFRRNGPDSEPLPTRFWRVVGKGFDQTICEPHLVLLNYLIKRKRERHGI